MRRRSFCRTTLSAGIAAAFPASGLLAQLRAMSSVPAEIPAVTTTGDELSIEPAAAMELAEALDGVLLFPGDERYESARKVWNGMIDRRPAMIAMCANSRDVSEAVTFAAERNLVLAVRGGGHSYPGKSVCDRGLMINLAGMTGVEVDPDARVARVQGGALLGQLDGATLAHELATTAGVVSHTGVGGFTLGGGMGRTDRVFGLAVDNLLSATLVTADGRVREVGPEQDEDLYWAIRGGGGNFGVATEFRLRLHPFDPMIYGGYLSYEWSQTRDVLSHWAEIGDMLPDGASIEPYCWLTPEGQRTFGVELYFTGDAAAGEREFARFVEATRPQSANLGLKSYQAVQTEGDVVTAHGQLDYLKSGFFPELTPGAIDAIVESYEGDYLPTTWFQHLGGATARVDPQATAFAHRRVHSNYGVDGRWTDPAESERRIARIREIYAAVEPHMSGFYTNLNDDTKSKTQSNYGVNYPRLVEIKKRFDPNNLFRLNANIDPTVA